MNRKTLHIFTNSILIYIIIISNTSIVSSQTNKSVHLDISFPHQKNESIKIGIYENTFIEDQYRIFLDTVSDEKGLLSTSIAIEYPSILILQSEHGTFRIYVTPHDSIGISIYNRLNLKFTGNNADFNKFLLEQGLLLDAFMLISYPENITADSMVSEIYQTFKNQVLLLNKLSVGPDCIQYGTGEILGNTYFKLMNLKNAFKNKGDTVEEMKIDNYIYSFIEHDFIFMDESRSRRYNNLLLIAKREIEHFNKINKDVDCKTAYFKDKYIESDQYYLINTRCMYPNIYRLFLYAYIHSSAVLALKKSPFDFFVFN